MKKKRAATNFRVKKSTAAKAVQIEGFANKAVADRVKDLIPGEAWELDNFKKNPIIFFNHDRNLPIGKATHVEATKEGLKIKVKISKSNEAPIPYIRDMIKEGIVKTFSVGFDDHGTFKQNDDGLNVPDRAELLETSVVTLPMNQDSDFTMAKNLSSLVSTWKTKSYHEAKQDVLRCKGAWLSLMIENAINDLAKDIDFDKDDAFEKIALNSHLTIQQVLDIVNGEAKDVDDEVLAAISESLSIDYEKLKEESDRQKAEDEDMEDDEEDKEDKEAEDEEEDEEEDDEEEDEKDFEPKFEKNSFQDCVAKKIPIFLEEGMDQDQAVAAAISYCQEKKGECDLSKEDYEAFLKIADRQKQDASDEVGMDSSKESEVNFPNPLIDLQKAQLSMQGTTVQLLREIKEELRLMNTKFNGETPQTEEVDLDSNEEEDSEKSATSLDRKQKILDDFEKRLKKLTSALGEE